MIILSKSEQLALPTSFNDFIQEYSLKNKATTIIKKEQILSFLALREVRNFLDDPLKFGIGSVSLHPFQGTQWYYIFTNVVLIHLVFHHLTKLSKLFKKRNGCCLFSDYKLQGLVSKRVSYYATYCLFIFNLTNILRKVSKTAVLNL